MSSVSSSSCFSSFLVSSSLLVVSLSRTCCSVVRCWLGPSHVACFVVPPKVARASSEDKVYMVLERAAFSSVYKPVSSVPLTWRQDASAWWDSSVAALVSSVCSFPPRGRTRFRARLDSATTRSSSPCCFSCFFFTRRDDKHGITRIKSK